MFPPPNPNWIKIILSLGRHLLSLQLNTESCRRLNRDVQMVSQGVTTAKERGCRSRLGKALPLLIQQHPFYFNGYNPGPGSLADALIRSLREPLPQFGWLQIALELQTQMTYVETLQFITPPTRIFSQSHDFTENVTKSLNLWEPRLQGDHTVFAASYSQ